MDTYQLNQDSNIMAYASDYFLYDRRLTGLTHLPTASQKVDKAAFEALEAIRKSGFFSKPQTLESLDHFLAERNFTGLDGRFFVDHHLLIKHDSPADAAKQKMAAYFLNMFGDGEGTPKTTSPPKTEARDRFEKEEGDLVFSDGHFFNLPAGIDSEQCDVGLLGMPLASIYPSLGTEVAPRLLRGLSRNWNWFDIYKDGVYHEASLKGNMPEVICDGVHLKDFGDLDFRGKSLKAVFTEIEDVINANFIRPKLAPLIVGGDHAVTFPILSAYLKAVPELNLLHLDAHNDLFYASKVTYSHAAPISNLLKATPLKQVLSFGLRTFSGGKAGQVRAFEQNAETDRCALFSITTLKQMIMQPEMLRSVFKPFQGQPFYLSIDLDVLSSRAMGSQLSTPFGPGLEWHELFYFLGIAFEELNIMGADVVEFNPASGGPVEEGSYYLNALMMLLIDRLAKHNRAHFSR